MSIIQFLYINNGWRCASLVAINKSSKYWLSHNSGKHRWILLQLHEIYSRHVQRVRRSNNPQTWGHPDHPWLDTTQFLLSIRDKPVEVSLKFRVYSFIYKTTVCTHILKFHKLLIINRYKWTMLKRCSSSIKSTWISNEILHKWSLFSSALYD